MHNETKKTPTTWQADSDLFKETPDQVQQVTEYLKLYRFKTQEALDGLEDNVVRALKVYRRWNVALSALVGLLFIAVALLAVRAYESPKKMPAAATGTAAVTAVSDSADTAADAQPAPAPEAAVQTSEPAKPANLLTPEKAEKIIKLRSEYALTYFKRATFDRLAAKYIHPEKGVHFYPMGLKAAGNAFGSKTFGNVMFNPVEYDWGKTAANDAPVKTDFVQYYKTYIYDEDFLTASSVRFNEISFPGQFELSAAAIAQRFPDCIFTEYRKNGKSLILVFQQYDGPGVWYLVGVIHNA